MRMQISIMLRDYKPAVCVNTVTKVLIFVIASSVWVQLMRDRSYVEIIGRTLIALYFSRRPYVLYELFHIKIYLTNF